MYFDKPLYIPSELADKPECSDCYVEADRLFDRKNKESSFRLFSGTINVINYVLNQRGDPFETIVFLDKSARLAAHLFRVTWSLLQQRKLISEEFARPNIRFFNVGKGSLEKAKSDASQSLLASKLRTADYEKKRVLVVDEVVASGSSSRLAMNVLRNIFGARVETLEAYSREPGWYGCNWMKGVDDSEDILFGINKKELLSMDSRVAQAFNRLFSLKLDEATLFNLFVTCNGGIFTFNELNKLVVVPITEEKVGREKLKRMLDEHFPHITISLEDFSIISKHIFDSPRPYDEKDIQVFQMFFRTSGTFLTRPASSKENFRTHLQFRKQLTQVAEYLVQFVGLR